MPLGASAANAAIDSRGLRYVYRGRLSGALLGHNIAIRTSASKLPRISSSATGYGLSR
jgi:hypothetical protein